jgi:Bacterial Ig-like domain
VPINATPRLDFNSTSGTLTFAAGQTSAIIQVPVLADPWDAQNELLNVVLSSPGGGASIGAVSSAQLTIIDVDPKLTPPHVSQLTWTGSAKSITSVVLTFDSPLNTADATNPQNYVMTAESAGNPKVTFNTISYSLANRTVTLVPAAPLASGVFYQLLVVGTGATGIHDLAGNPLAGTANGAAGTNYVSSFGQGTKLQYVDNTGNQVTLKLTGPGYLEDVLDSSGQGVVLTVIGEAPHRTTLSGSLRKVRRSSGRTNLGTIQGLGNFGDVRVSLKSPTFLLNQYPFQKKGRGAL